MVVPMAELPMSSASTCPRGPASGHRDGMIASRRDSHHLEEVHAPHESRRRTLDGCASAMTKLTAARETPREKLSLRCHRSCMAASTRHLYNVIASLDVLVIFRDLLDIQAGKLSSLIFRRFMNFVSANFIDTGFITTVRSLVCGAAPGEVFYVDVIVKRRRLTLVTMISKSQLSVEATPGHMQRCPHVSGGIARVIR